MRREITTSYIQALERCRRKETSDFMCRKLKELNGKSAEDILKISGQLYNIPVDIEKIVTAIEVYKHPRTFSDLEEIEKKKSLDWYY